MGAPESDWRPMRTAPRDGTRILVTVRETEQGPAEVDMVRWAKAEPAAEYAWLATDSDAAARIVYGDGELAAWMPVPAANIERGPRPAFVPYMGEEIDGSAI